MNDNIASGNQDQELAGDSSWLEAEVDGRPVRFWVLVGLAIAVVTLGFGAWWVWGLDRSTGLVGAPSEIGEMVDMSVSTNGIERPGPFGFQADVFPSAPGDEAYRPLRRVVLVSWVEESRARELRSTGEVAAVETGEIALEQTEAVVNMPFLTWPGGGADA